MATLRDKAWQLFDAILAQAATQEAAPWVEGPRGAEFSPNYDTLSRLLGVPVMLGAASQSGVPALALDVWVASEFRRAGFDPDAVWPRQQHPRVLATEVSAFVNKLPARDRARLRELIDSGKSGSGSSSANLLGKNYVKQVDVVMSSWATGPELMVSTKRMDSSFGKNAANRVEESYGDAKNLRLRYPLAALGFVYGLSAIALETDKETTAWLIDLLQKLGREDDAYHAVALVLPDLSKAQEAPGEEVDEAGPLPAGEASEPERPLGDESGVPDIDVVPWVELVREEVPYGLDPGRFFTIMVNRVLDNTPVNFHREARARRATVARDLTF
jgi:hypothetical protein